MNACSFWTLILYKCSWEALRSGGPCPFWSSWSVLGCLGLFGYLHTWYWMDLSLGITSHHADNRLHQVENKQVCVATCACECPCVGSSPSIPPFAQAACGTHWFTCIYIYINILRIYIYLLTIYVFIYFLIKEACIKAHFMQWPHWKHAKLEEPFLKHLD